jgi:ABC-type iron transport system FetAB permease component
MPPPTLLWSQVTAAFALVAFNSAISQVLQLDVGASLVIAALRCMVQLIVVTFVLRYVFAVESMWAVVRLARRFPTVLLQE